MKSSSSLINKHRCGYKEDTMKSSSWNVGMTLGKRGGGGKSLTTSKAVSTGEERFATT